MNKLHITIVAGLLAGAAVLGTVRCRAHRLARRRPHDGEQRQRPHTLEAARSLRGIAAHGLREEAAGAPCRAERDRRPATSARRRRSLA